MGCGFICFNWDRRQLLDFYIHRHFIHKKHSPCQKHIENIWKFWVTLKHVSVTQQTLKLKKSHFWSSACHMLAKICFCKKGIETRSHLTFNISVNIAPFFLQIKKKIQRKVHFLWSHQLIKRKLYFNVA